MGSGVVPIVQDVQIARRVLASLWHSRSTRREVARRTSSAPKLRPRSIRIAVYFADADVNLYQIRQWYAPLAALSKLWPTAIISRSPGAAIALMDEAPVPTVYLRLVDDLESFLAEQDVRIVLYVNQNSRNFQMMRYSRMWHVFINHGESDKVYMTTNQYKAYDYSFVAGKAAIDRLSRKLWDFDIPKRVLEIGRPQTDHLGGSPPYEPDGRMVVLYAPTWEGDRATAAYGSIASHGVTLVKALIVTGRHRVVYRPHPRSGVLDAAYRRADETIKAALAAANASDPSAHHVVDSAAELGWQLTSSDVAITDISAMVYDRLATGKPLVVTRPTSDVADVDESGFLGDADWLAASDAGDVVAVLDRVAASEESRARLNRWVDWHFGDTTTGQSTARFHAAIERLMTEWDRHATMHAHEPDGPDFSGDTDDDGDDEQVIRRR